MFVYHVHRHMHVCLVLSEARKGHLDLLELGSLWALGAEPRCLAGSANAEPSVSPHAYMTLQYSSFEKTSGFLQNSNIISLKEIITLQCLCICSLLQL